MPKRTQSPAFFARPLIAALAVCLLTGALYARAVGYPFLRWDDTTYLTERSALRRLAAGDSRAFVDLLKPPLQGEFWEYYPLRDVSYGVEARLIGFEPAVFHAVNIALHIGCALLLLFIARRFVSPSVALFAALLFALHPLGVEPVAWIAGRKDVLYSFFALLAIWQWSKRDYQKRASLADLWAVVFGLCAMASKGPGAVVAPILLWLALRHPATRARKSQLVLYASLLLVAIGWVVFSLYIGHQSGIILHETAAPASFWLALGAPGHAVERAIAPFFLSPVYEMGGRIDVRSLLTIAVLAALVIAVLRPLWNRKNNNTIANSSLAVSTSFFVAAFLALIPTAGLVRVAQHRADRFLYLPLALFCIGLAPWLERAWRSTTKRWTVLVIAVLSGYAALSYQTLDHWSNDVTLWKAALKEAPEHPIALGQLGALALTQGHFDLAERLLRRSIKRQPAMPKSWSNLGRLYRYRAEKLAASPARKSSAEPQKALYRAAAAAFSKALSFDRDYLSARAELALVRFRLGQREKARRMLEELLEARSPPLSAALYLAEMSWAKDPGAARRLVDKHCRLRADPPACVRWRKKHALTR